MARSFNKNDVASNACDLVFHKLCKETTEKTVMKELKLEGYISHYCTNIHTYHTLCIIIIM